MDSVDREIVLATQEGLPIDPQPYHRVAERVGVSPEEVMERMRRMVDAGIIRRIGAVPNHYRLGYRGNGMSVWDVPDDKVTEIGQRLGALDFVSHCYQRPRHLPEWPYNLFIMVHGPDRDAVQRQVDYLAELLGEDDRGHEILYSSRILKKTGLRIAGQG
ncbi:MAG: Lrp/AsnC family transcriptional regulator [Gammaproteobacteria bacterium]